MQTEQDLSWVTFSSSGSSTPCEGFDLNDCHNEAVWIVYAQGSCPTDKTSDLCDLCLTELKNAMAEDHEFMCEHGYDVIFTRVERIPR